MRSSRAERPTVPARSKLRVGRAGFVAIGFGDRMHACEGVPGVSPGDVATSLGDLQDHRLLRPPTKEGPRAKARSANHLCVRPPALGLDRILPAGHCVPATWQLPMIAWSLSLRTSLRASCRRRGPISARPAFRTRRVRTSGYDDSIFLLSSASRYQWPFEAWTSESSGQEGREARFRSPSFFGRSRSHFRSLGRTRPSSPGTSSSPQRRHPGWYTYLSQHHSMTRSRRTSSLKSPRRTGATPGVAGCGVTSTSASTTWARRGRRIGLAGVGAVSESRFLSDP